ncbi:response regulator transcription factor [Vogesella mureinivorans]|jgi:two-component system OmpR family response regulator|uniref:response regulator transcription factor n=1 Tax=Vogesella mureinivorans TaxID=657276 RepID=UPI0011C847AA|nr:response regulator transcription factor [Vogesella mureinivorans]
MKLLIAEDDAVLADALLTRLDRLGFATTHAADGLLAQQLLLAEAFDAVILDIGLPGLDGLQVLRNVRVHKPALPILILTALDSMEDRVAGLDAGADDYLVKPFEFPELEARIRALLRRHRVAEAVRDELHFASLRLDRAGQRVWAGEQALDLSARELQLMDILMANGERVVTKEQIAGELAADGEEVGVNAVEVYVHRLRKKLDGSGVGIRAVRGLGYLLAATDDA